MSKFQVPELKIDFGDISLYDYQVEAVTNALNHCRESNDPAYISASVSSGKSLMIAAIARHFERVNEAAVQQGFKATHQVLMLVRTGDLVKQNAEEAWSIRCKNSIWCAGLGVKSQVYPCIMGSEKSVYNSLNKELKNFRPTIILIDEMHNLNYEDKDTQMMSMIEEFRRRNKNVKIIGLSGTCYRGTEPVLGDFWKKELSNISRDYLTKRGFVMPVEFGFGVGDKHYDSYIDGINPVAEGDVDLTKSQLAEVEKKILSEGEKTHEIMLDIMKVMENRNCVLLTVSGKKHAELAAKYLPKGSYAIITEKTSSRERIEIKNKCHKGEIKYVLQIAVWLVGVSIPRIDTIGILRPMGSYVQYEQLIGRGVRKLKQHDIDAGIVKNECLVLDYTDTSAMMAELMDSDELGQAEQKRAKANNEELQQCPKCGQENSLRARRCSGLSDSGHRCDYFFSFKTCDDMYNQKTGQLSKKGCGTQNDPASKTCRSCGGFMKDPNENLLNTAYSKDDLINVVDFKFGLTRAGDKLVAQYKLANGSRAREVFDISKREKWRLATWSKFTNDHITDKIAARAMFNCRDAKKAMQYADQIKAPVAVTHRKNDKNFDIIARKIFED
ncbi:helicase [Vibrio phage 466E53-1]|nr:helicase [Vibrio phage 466E53-1]